MNINKHIMNPNILARLKRLLSEMSYWRKPKLFLTNAHMFEADNDINKKAEYFEKNRIYISIYRTIKHYAIVTGYRTESGIWLSGEPVWLLPLDTTSEELSKVISEGLSHSRSVSEPEEDIIRMSNKNNLLKRMKERSWSSLYRNSKCCSVDVGNNEIIITPWISSVSQRGLVSDSDRVVRLAFVASNHMDIAQAVMDMLR